jgi:hypothetical protein
MDRFRSSPHALFRGQGGKHNTGPLTSRLTDDTFVEAVYQGLLPYDILSL